MFVFKDYYGNFKETNEEYETRKYLDSLPWDTLLTPWCDLSNLMQQIEDTYGNTLKDNPTFQGYVFNWMSPDEFADYIRSKGYYVIEEVIVKYTLGGRKDGTNQ